MNLSKAHHRPRMVAEFYAKFSYNTVLQQIINLSQSDLITSIEHLDVGDWRVNFSRNILSYPEPYVDGVTTIRTPIAHVNYEGSVGFLQYSWNFGNYLSILALKATISLNDIESVAPADDMIIVLSGGWPQNKDCKYKTIT